MLYFFTPPVELVTPPAPPPETIYVYGAGASDANGTYLFVEVDIRGMPTYVCEDSGFAIYWSYDEEDDEGYWTIFYDDLNYYNANYVGSPGSDVASPDLVEAWDADAGDEPAPTVSATPPSTYTISGSLCLSNGNPLDATTLTHTATYVCFDGSTTSASQVRVSYETETLSTYTLSDITQGTSGSVTLIWNNSFSYVSASQIWIDNIQENSTGVSFTVELAG